MEITQREKRDRRKAFIAPFFLILIWSTGFIAARAVADHADPNLFLTFRFLIAAAVFALLALHCAWPKGRQFVMHLLTGMLMNGVYLAASWWAVAKRPGGRGDVAHWRIAAAVHRADFRAGAA